MSSEPSLAPTSSAPTLSPTGEPAIGFLDPHALIATSGVQRFVPPAWPVLLIALALVFGAATLDAGAGTYRGHVILVIGLSVLWVGNGILRQSVSRAIAAEVAAVTALDELVQLRRWPEAADLAQKILSRPMFLRERRLSALVSLATLLTRYHRFEDARVVHDYLLSGREDGFEPDASTGHAIRVARAMGMLREDRLVDADRAMGDLRREVKQARDDVRREQGHEAAAEVQSAGVALLDLYRDVKTRHYEEAVTTFERALPTMRKQLGVRVADAWVLVAAAHDGLGQTDAARTAYDNATALTPSVELHRRYPETQTLAERYTPAAWPVKVGQA